MKIIRLILILIILSVNLNGYEPEFSKKEAKQKGRAESFWNCRKSYLSKPSQLFSIFKSLKQSEKNNNQLLSSDIWTELGPTNFTTETILNNGFGRLNTLEFNPKDSNELWAGSAGGGLWIYNIKNKFWKSNKATDYFSIGISDIAFSPTNPDIVYIATGDARGGKLFRGYSLGILMSTDNGKSWEIVEDILQSDLVFIKKIIVSHDNPYLIYFASSNGLYSFDIQKQESKALYKGYYFSDIEFAPSNPNIIYAATSNYKNNYVFKSTDSGVNWDLIHEIYNSNRIELLTLKNYPNELYCLSDKFAGSERAALYKSTDHGSTFKNLLNSNSSQKLVQTQGAYNLILNVNPNDNSNIFVGGVPLHLSFDNGKNFEKVSFDIHEDQHDLIFGPDNKIYLANDGGLYVSDDSGYNWKNLSEGLGITQFYRSTSNPFNPDIYFAGSQDNGLIIFEDSLRRHSLSGDAMDTRFAVNKPERIVSALQAGQLYLSQDGGKTYSSPYISINIPELGPWITPFYVSDSGDSILAGFKNLWLTQDDGKTWKSLTQFSGDEIYISSVEFSDFFNIFLFSRGNNLYKIKDGKVEIVNSFTEVITSIYCHKAEIYITLGGFSNNEKVYLIDSLNKILNISSNLINIPINSLTIDDSEENNIYIGCDAGVFKYNSSKKQWENFSEGLGFPIVNEIEYNKQNGCLTVATFGRGLWKRKIRNCGNEKFSLNQIGSIILCQGDSLNLSIVEPKVGMNYLWSDGSKGNTLIVKTAKDFFAYYIDSNNCINSSNIVSVSYHPKLEIQLRSIGNNPICKGDTALIEVLSDEDSLIVEWSNGFTGNPGKFIDPGNYYAVVTNKNGCRDTSTQFDILQNELPEKPLISYENNSIRITNNNPSENKIWYLNDDILTDIHFDKFYPVKSGYYKVKVIDTNYCKQESNLIHVSPENLNYNPYLFPNPAIDQVTVHYFSDSSKTIRIRLYSLLGGFINEFSHQSILGINTININLSNYSQGIYYFEFYLDGFSKYLGFIKTEF